MARFSKVEPALRRVLGLGLGWPMPLKPRTRSPSHVCTSPCSRSSTSLALPITHQPFQPTHSLIHPPTHSHSSNPTHPFTHPFIGLSASAALSRLCCAGPRPHERPGPHDTYSYIGQASIANIITRACVSEIDALLLLFAAFVMEIHICTYAPCAHGIALHMNV